MLRIAAFMLACTLAAALPARAETPPERIVALSWGLAETLLALDVIPAGVADVDGYATWVATPPLPEGVADVGLRNEPNLERIAALAPDLILASDQQGDMVPMLERIAPVVHYEAFDKAQGNADRSRAVMRDLARRLGEPDRAERVLAEIDTRMAEAGKRVRAHFHGDPPPVLPIRLLTDTTVRVHGANSMALAALEGMGLRHPAPGEATDWGFAQVGIRDLARYEDAAVLHIEPFADKQALYASQLWRFMPFVRAGRYAEVAPVWTFGGALSQALLAEAFADALTTLPPDAGR